MAKVMVIDSGARGHAIALAYLADGKNVDRVIVAPGNDGISENILAKDGLYRSLISIDSRVSLKNPKTICESVLVSVKAHKPDLIDIAQDDALAAGVGDLLRKEEFRVFAPTKKASQIEWDKSWSRDFMKKYEIASPKYEIFRKGEDERAREFALGIIKDGKKAFLKASGLFAGKGVVSAENEEEINRAIEKLNKMGRASDIFLVEEGIVGEEFSYFAMVDGKNFICFKSAQDNKRAFVGDIGPMTGGIGANAPALVTRGLEKRIEEEIIRRTVSGLAYEGRHYTGILYFGGMICKDNRIIAVEFNSRWGDPEVHVVIPGIKNSYFELVNNAIDGKLREVELKEDNLSRVCIVGASAGYPNDHTNSKGKRIWIDNSKIPTGVYFLSAGIKVKNKELYTDGGRLFSVVAKGRDVSEARIGALQGIACCSVEDNCMYYRPDIAWRDVQRSEKLWVKTQRVF